MFFREIMLERLNLELEMRLLTLISLLLSSISYASIFNIKDTTINGEAFQFSQFKGKVVLVVNIASQCGFTGQLNDLEMLYNKYRSQNFVVLGVPTNDFGGQTPENDKEMLEFCQKKYNVSFPLLSKKTIKGKEKRELYKFLTERSGKDLEGEVFWNFEKFLIDKNGKVIARYRSITGPNNSDLREKIEKALKK